MPAGNAGRRYAQAIFEIAQRQNKIDDWMADLNNMAQTFDEPEVKRYFKNPESPRTLKRTFVQNVLAKNVSPAALNLAMLLVQHGREAYIDAIRTEYTRMVNRLRGIEIAQVTTAVPVDEAEKQQIQQRLSRITGKEVQVELRVDPSIIGGIVARVGDTLIDGSVATRLQALRKQLA